MKTIDKIYNEDCLKTMADMEANSVDIVLTSPPYNISRQLKNREYGLKVYNCKYKEYTDNLSNDEYREWMVNVFHSFDKILKKDGVVLYNISYATELREKAELMWLVNTDIITKTAFTIADCIIWKKRNAMPTPCCSNHLTRICEFVMVFTRKNDYDTFKMNREVISTSVKGQKMYNVLYNYIEAPNNDGFCKEHKATFSTSFVGKLLNMYSEEGMVVYDPFMGIGTTAIAAYRAKRHYIGSEISKEYCDIAEKRIENEQRQLTLF